MGIKFLQEFKKAWLAMALCVVVSFAQGQTYTFTAAGATGINGPSQAQVNTAYASTNLSGSVTVTGGIQSWSIPIAGLYKIEVYGANGYGVYGGKGAYMSGEFNFNASDVLKILVGQQGGCCHSTGTNQYGGGGGSFVVDAINTPLIIAGGGGGAATFYSSVNLASSHNPVADANITTSGKTAAGTTNGAGGTAGSGGNDGSGGGGGGGFLTDGLPAAQGGKSFLNGGTGGNGSSGLGGFGGGGGITGQNNMRAGGGGGYSGGGGCGSSTSVVQIAGGGGSYNSGSNQINTPALGTGDGIVVITLLQPAVSLPNNVGLTAFPSLSGGICPGSQTVSVRLRNFGNNFVNTVKIGWEVNSVLQTDNFYSVALDTFPAPGYDTTIVLGNYNFGSGAHMVKAWTSLPNLQVDPDTNNDTSTISVTPKLGGAFTLNSAVPSGGTNYQTFAAFVADLTTYGVCAPVVLNVVPGSGPYNEQIIIPAIVGVNATNTITINGNGATLGFASTNANLRAVIMLDGADYITIDSLVINANAGTYGWGVHLTNDASNNIIRKCTINSSTTIATANYFAPVVLNGSVTTLLTTGNSGSDNLITDNMLIGGYYGVVLYGNSAAPNMGNVVSNNDIREFYAYGCAVSYISGPLISGNDFSRPTRTGTTTASGVFLTTGTIGALTEKNRVHNLYDALGTNTGTCYGLYSAADALLGQENKFVNNLVYNINHNGPAYGIYNAGGDYMQAYHNTISLDDQATTTGTAYGIYQTTVATGIDYKNNLVTVTRSGTGIKRCIHFNTTTSTITSNNNVLYLNAAGGTNNHVGQFGTTNYTTLANWQAGANGGIYDTASVDVNPQYASPGTGNFIFTNLAMDNLGKPLGITTDILGNPRDPVMPDIGAYELPNSPCTAPPTAGTASATPTSGICGGASIQVGLSGFSSGSGQTYVWESSPMPGGPFSPVTSSLQAPSTSITATNSLYYRCAVTCGASTSYSNEVYVSVGAISGIASAQQDTVCFGGIAGLSLTGHTGDNIQWEAYDNGTSSWLPISGATTANYSFNGILVTTIFRAAVSCNTPTGVVYSNPDTVVVINPSIVDVFPGSRCDAGPVTLAARGAAGTSVKWYAAQTGGTPLGTGSAYTTPTISTNTTYYAAAATGSGGGAVPELMYYKFDVPGSTVQNEASSPVGNNPATITGLTIGGTGQFGTGLQGNAGATASNNVNPGWTGTHTGSWTISFWMNVPTPPTTRYMFGNSSGNGTFRCFIGGAANTIRLTGGVPSTTLDMPNWVPGISVVTYVYNQSLGTVRGYINGVFQASASPGASYPLDGTNFVVGSQGTSIEGTMDEFRMYNRALSDAEIASTWNTTLGGCEGTRVPVLATISGVTSGTGLSTGGTTIGLNHTDGATVNYNDGCNDKVATVIDGVGGNVLGVTSAIAVTSSTVQTFNNKPYVQRVFDITPASNGPATVTLYALQSEFTAYNSYVTSNSLSLPLLPTGPSDAAGMANIVITQFHGSALSATTGPLGLYDAQNSTFITNSSITVAWTGNYWAMTFPVTGFSGFFIHSGSTPLEIALLEISAQNMGKRNRIDWNTATEQRGDVFELERSGDGNNFSKLSVMNVKGEASSYTYWDENPVGGVNHYRLKIIDATGNFSYSKVVTATVKVNGGFAVEAYPNPVSAVLTLQVYGAAGNNATVTIADVTGKVIRMISVTDNNAQINMSGVAPGVYLVKYADSKQSQVIKVNKR